MNAPADAGAAPETRRLLEYFYSVAGLRTLSGQHVLYWQWENAGEPALAAPDQHVLNTVNRIPAVFGTDFGDVQNASDRQNIINLLRQQYDSGRIVTVSYHFPGTRGDLAGVVDPANTTVRPAFFARVEELVTLLRGLDVDGTRVPVIFRPLHEMNAPWPIIWWGKDGSANLKALWQEIWNRFHNRAVPAENLHNVLWMFSANAWLDSPPGTVDPPNDYYPGAAYVDMLGADIYTEAGYTWNKQYHDVLLALGGNRPIAITESGSLPDVTALRAAGQTQWAYWLTWYDRYGTDPAGDGSLPNNTPAKYQALANEPAVVWSAPDIYLRDLPTDAGLVLPSAEYVDDAAGRHWWYESPDVKVDANPASAADLTVPANFEAFAGESPTRTTINQLYVNVHNRGPGVATNVKVKCLWTDATAGIPPLPADYWQYFPDAWVMASAWTPVDAASAYAVIPAIPPRSSRVAKIAWQVPATAADHTCMLAMVTCVGDALIGNASSGVRTDKRISLRNLHVIDNPVFPFKLRVQMYPDRPFATAGELAIDTAEMAPGLVRIAVTQRSVRPLRLLEGRGTAFRRVDHASTERGVTRVEMEVAHGTRRSLAVEHLPRISGIELTPERPASVEIEWEPSQPLEPGSVHVLRVLQFEQERPRGGSTFLIRMPPRRGTTG
jgi:mannan endo-1,4-beta-mannosidase